MAEIINRKRVGKIKDISGQRFGRLLVVEFSHIDQNKKATWLCLCDCGTKITAISGNMISGITKSCGCLKREKRTSHNMSHTSEYCCWAEMIQRCTNPNHKHFKDYGGRGICVCERWLNSFENFYADVGPRPSPKHSIERINNDGNYCPENCKWATKFEQVRNRRDTVNITFKGKTQCIKDWAKEFGVSGHTIALRIKMGIPIDSPKRNAGPKVHVANK